MAEKKRFKRVYLDIETYRPEEGMDFVGEDIILVGLLYEDAEKPVFFENFSRDRERDVLLELYQHLTALSELHRVEIVGFNVLRYDIPLIVAKSLKHGVVKELGLFRVFGGVHDAEVLGKFWHSIPTVDLIEVLLPFNNMEFKGLSLCNVVNALRTLAEKLGMHECTITAKCDIAGEDVKKLYECKRYDMIKKKNSDDLTTVKELYKCITLLTEKKKCEVFELAKYLEPLRRKRRRAPADVPRVNG